MGTLTDEDLRHLLGEAAGSFEEPEDGIQGVFDALGELVVVPLRRRRWVQVPAAAAVVAGAVLGGVLLSGHLGGGDAAPTTAAARAPAAAGPKGATKDGTFNDLHLGLKPQGAAAAGDTAPGALRNLPFAYSPGAGSQDTRGPLAAAAAPRGSDQSVKSLINQGRTLPAVPALPNAVPLAPAAATAPDGARVVKTGSIALLVADRKVTPTLTSVQALAKAVGGIVSTAKTEESGPTPSGSVTLRVPVASFEDVVAKVRGLDAEVRSATTSGQDITAQYADLQVQIKTLTAARDRFLLILSKATTVGDILSVQQRVDDTTGKIDRLEGQRRVLAAQSDMATLEVSVTQRDDPAVAPQQRSENGLAIAFRDAWHGFTGGVESLISISGQVLLLVICLGIALIVLRLGWRTTRRRLV